MEEKPIVTPISGPPQYPQPPIPPYSPPPRRSTALGCFAIFAGVGLACSLLFVLILLAAGAGAGGELRGPSSLHEKVVEGEGDAKVALVRIEGIIAEHPESAGLFGMPSESLPRRIRDQLEKARKDDAVKSVILQVDSPGGTVTASDEIWKALVKFREDAKKPLLVHQGALAASGGYYVSAAADEIWASPTTITGSIGVIMQGLNVSKFLEDHGVKDVTIKSGANKDLLNPFSPEDKEHRRILQATVDDMYERFCEVVADGIAHRTGKKREDVMPAVKKLADGRIYTSKQALELKLVDSVGYLDDVFEAAKKKAGVAQAKLVRYSKQPSFMDVLSGNVEARLDLGRGVAVRADARLLDELRAPRFLMLWQGE